MTNHTNLLVAIFNLINNSDNFVSNAQKIGGQDPYPSPEWRFVPFTHPINTIGFTAASIPCGFDTDGMPVGLHIEGKHGDEESVLAVSAAFEAAQPWIHHRPQIS